jgi:lysophospholipase L1-like esterase
MTTALIIGDSTTVHMPTFPAELERRGITATIDAVSGRSVYQGRAVLARHDPAAYDIVAILLGANGLRPTMRRNFRALRRMGADTAATVQAPRQRVVNDAIRGVFGDLRISWAGWAAAHGITTTDGKHYTSEDYRTRARYLATAIARRADA